MTDEVKCEFCGENMILAAPIDYYCETPGCSDKHMDKAMKMVDEMFKRERRKMYEDLKKEFGDE